MQSFATGVLQAMSLPPCPTPAAANRKRQLLGRIRTRMENASFRGGLKKSYTEPQWIDVSELASASPLRPERKPT